mmetsp:Transcript_19223/g.39482  ORF Transcript_19223/g.39482 Transcript_19223/m.39482 type:complete len:240 (+) Transcript_19223:158-877(+)
MVIIRHRHWWHTTVVVRYRDDTSSLGKWLLERTVYYHKAFVVGADDVTSSKLLVLLLRNGSSPSGSVIAVKAFDGGTDLPFGSTSSTTHRSRWRFHRHAITLHQTQLGLLCPILQKGQRGKKLGRFPYRHGQCLHPQGGIRQVYPDAGHGFRGDNPCCGVPAKDPPVADLRSPLRITITGPADDPLGENGVGRRVAHRVAHVCCGSSRGHDGYHEGSDPKEPSASQESVRASLGIVGGI